MVLKYNIDFFDLVNFYNNLKKMNLCDKKEDNKTFNQKIMYTSFFEHTDIKTKCADKILVRDYCFKKLNYDYFPKIIKIYNNVDEIHFNELPSNFIIKCNHGCGYNIKIFNKENNITELDSKYKLKYWMSKNYSYYASEIQYYNINRKCFAEECVALPCDLIEYKIHCFNDGPLIIQEIEDRDTDNDITYNFYDSNFKYIPDMDWNQDIKKITLNKPSKMDEMLNICSILKKDFKYVRIDFLYNNKTNNFYLCELTFTPGAFKKVWKGNYNNILGNYIKL